MLTIGLTGGIGSGKSTVASILAAQGVPVMDADAISRSCTQVGGAAMAKIHDAFGAAVIAPDGSLNRDAMRERMLADKQAKALLENIIHPLVGEQINAQLQQAEQAGVEIAVIDIPLLVEGAARWRSRLHRIWVVDCTSATRMERVRRRSGWPTVQIEAVMAAQASRVQRLACADSVIFNDAMPVEQLREQVLELLAQQKPYAAA